MGVTNRHSLWNSARRSPVKRQSVGSRNVCLCPSREQPACGGKAHTLSCILAVRSHDEYSGTSCGIDHCSQSNADDYMADWRRAAPVSCGDDLEAEADAAMARIEAEYDDARLKLLVDALGKDAAS